MRRIIEQTWGWDEAWQRRDFDRRFEEYHASVIECDHRPVGGLLVESRPDSIHIQELQVMPEYQGRGLGTAVVQQVLADAARRAIAVTLSVVPANPRAKQLYERLGFTVTEFDAPFFRMRHDARQG
jgi:ribosomal protein S18 acetylase RimI-like enzyme